MILDSRFTIQDSRNKFFSSRTFRAYPFEFFRIIPEELENITLWFLVFWATGSKSLDM